MKLDSKVFRKAARLVLKYGKKEKYTTDNYRFSCLVLRNVLGVSDVEYNNLYGNLESAITDYEYFISYTSIECSHRLISQRQLHRALMLDLMAEMIEQGDL